MLALLFMGLVLTGTAVGWRIFAPKQRIAIDIRATVLLQSLPSPSLASLARLGFTDVGTDAELLLNQTEQNTLRHWVEEAHRNGLRTFAMIGDAGSALGSAELDFKIGFDYVEFDDFISEGKLPPDTLRSLVSDITVRYSTQILLTEYLPAALAAAVLLAGEVRGVVVASDNYVNRTSLLQIQEAGRSSGVEVAAWLIFYPDSLDVPGACYNDLERWMQDASQLGLSVYFFIVDPGGLWRGKWLTIQLFLESRQPLIATLRIVGIVSWAFICVAVFLPFLPESHGSSESVSKPKEFVRDRVSGQSSRIIHSPLIVFISSRLARV